MVKRLMFISAIYDKYVKRTKRQIFVKLDELIDTGKRYLRFRKGKPQVAWPVFMNARYYLLDDVIFILKADK